MKISTLFSCQRAVVTLVIIYITVCQASDNVINAARCRVRCVAELQRKVDSGLPLQMSSRASVSLGRCLEDEECTSCLKPCSQPFTTVTLCQRVCEPAVSSSCALSCQYLKDISAVRVGACPVTLVLDDSDSTSCDNITSCNTDDDCSRLLKCCYQYPCGRQACLPADYAHLGIPPTPNQPAVIERSKMGSIELKWNDVTDEASGIVLYIVDQRWNVGRHFSENSITDWQQIMQTTHNSIKIRDLTPGHWYQFRVTAVNVNGGFRSSDPSLPFRLVREPHPPSPPLNLTEGETEADEEGFISVTIYWLPPDKTDLPITRYKVYWSKKARNSQGLQTGHLTANSVKENRILIPGDQLRFKLTELEPDTTYNVQLQAISQYGDTRLKSERATLVIHTPPTPHLLDGVEPTPAVISRDQATPSPLHSLTAHNPYYEHGLLKANISWAVHSDVHKVLISWTPEVCIAVKSEEDNVAKTHYGGTHEDFFIVYDLRFDCRYMVRTQPVGESGVVGAISHISFPTPSCDDVLIKGSTGPVCPTKVPGLPELPVNLRSRLLFRDGRVYVVLTWEEPASDTAINGYRLVWSQAGKEKTNAFTAVLSKDDLSFTINDVTEATNYVVHLQALSKYGAGKIASLELKVPVLHAGGIDSGSAHKRQDQQSTTVDSSLSDVEVIFIPRSSSNSLSRCYILLIKQIFVAFIVAISSNHLILL